MTSTTTSARWGRGAANVVRVLVALLFAAPVLWSLLTSLKSTNEANQAPPTFLPRSLSLGNYADLLASSGMGRNVLNSLLVALLTVVGTLVLSILAGYGFARYRFRFRGALFVVVLAGLMVPVQAIIVPLYLMLNRVHLVSSSVGLALVYVTFQLPFSVFVMRNTIMGIPVALDEAARVDGCSRLMVLVRILLPVAMPGVITVALFAFLNSWNEFFAALILMNEGSSFTLPIALVNASTGELSTINWGALHAGVVISMIPCVLLYALLQRFYVSGLTSGAMK